MAVGFGESHIKSLRRIGGPERMLSGVDPPAYSSSSLLDLAKGACQLLIATETNDRKKVCRRDANLMTCQLKVEEAGTSTRPPRERQRKKVNLPLDPGDQVLERHLALGTGCQIALAGLPIQY